MNTSTLLSPTYVNRFASRERGDAPSNNGGMLPVYLIHYNAPEWLLAAAKTIKASKPVVRLIVVSNSGPIDVPGATVIVTERNGGYAGGANIAIQHWLFGSEPFAVIGSHDLHVQPDTFHLLLKGMARDPELGIAAPAMPDAGHGESFGGEYCRWVSGQCLLLRRECIQEIGLFDERFSSYVEDVDISLRAWDAGWKVGIVREAWAHGLGSALTSRTDVLHRQWANVVGLKRKRGGLARGMLELGMQPIFAAREVAAAARHPRGAAPRLRRARDRVTVFPAAVRALRRFG